MKSPSTSKTSTSASKASQSKTTDQRIDVLERQVRSLRRQVQIHDEWIDTMSSSFIKRLFWVLQGYRLHRVGRWYGKTEELR
jgi:hypothetical protein